MINVTRAIYSKVSRIVLIPAIALAIVTVASAQSSQPQYPGGPKEAITVHGHWAIEVRNPDGTLVRRQEFENALTSPGHLGKILGRIGVVGYWGIVAFDRQTSPCQGGSQSNDCIMTEAQVTQFNGTNVFKNLAISNDGFNDARLILRGSATALAAGRISEVNSNFGVCGGSPCGSLAAVPFTQAVLPSAVPVAAGQIIQITVTLSFS